MDLDELIRVFGEEDVEATAIGHFTDTGRLVLKYDGVVQGDLEMHVELAHGGALVLQILLVVVDVSHDDWVVHRLAYGVVECLDERRALSGARSAVYRDDTPLRDWIVGRHQLEAEALTDAGDLTDLVARLRHLTDSVAATNAASTTEQERAG